MTSPVDGQEPVVRHRPSVVLFDVVETMFSLAPVADVLERLDVASDLFFARLLRDGFAHAAAGTCAPFADVAGAVVAGLAPDATAAQQAEVVDAFAELPAHPDAEPALAALNDAGVTVHTLTNGGASTTEHLLDRSGLRPYVDRVLSVEGVSRWKPARDPYRYATSLLAVPPAATALVAVHAWDIHGAGRAGLTTGWCSRLEGTFTTVFDPPDVTGADLVLVADALLGLDTRPR